jgi:hypothetical protein
MNRNPKFLVALLCLLVLAVVASRQLFLFTVIPQSLLDPSAGRDHLWLAVSAATMACIAGALMILFFLRQDRSKWFKPPWAVVRPPVTLIDISTNNSSTPAPFNPEQWAHQNSWLLEGSADDRRPMLTGAGVSSVSASARRSIARHSHQVRYKEWSRERHD